MEKGSTSKLELHSANIIDETKLKSSFVAANVECFHLGTFRVPKPFHEQFGKKLPSRLRFRCKSNIWSGKYDPQLNCIYGLRTFMKFYGVRIFSIVQFDYYGHGLFDVKVYKESAIECDYPLSDPKAYKKSEATNMWRKDEFLIGYDTLKYDKRFALLSFNGFLHDTDYVEIEIQSKDIAKKKTALMLESNLEEFYEDWEDGNKVFLRFHKKTWKIEIKWLAGRCMFQKGWKEFARDAELVAGDSLILYKFTNDDKLLNVCIFKGDEYENDNGEEAMIFPRSFYKVLTPLSLDDGLIIVPKMVEEKYYEKLSQIKVIEVCGVESFFHYNQTNGCLKGLKKMTDFFDLRQKETIFFTMEQDNNTITARVYGVDGMEIDYLTRPLGLMDNSDSVWIWHIDWPSDDESEDNVEEEIPEVEPPVNENIMFGVGINNYAHSFSATLSKCHVHNRTQGVTIPSYVAPVNRDWIAGERVLLRTENGSWSIGLALHNGRARFSAGWNKFAKDNELKKRQILLFNMIDGEDGLIFDITK